MPTIPELPTATQTGPQDEIPISQSGVTKSVSVADLLSGTQAQMIIPSPSVLGRSSLGPGAPEALSIGPGIAVQNLSVMANGTDHATFAEEVAFIATDEAIINSSGTPKRLALPYLRGLFSAGSNISIQTSGVIAAQTDPSVTGTLQTLSSTVTTVQASIAAVNARLPAGQIVALNGSGQITQPVAGDASHATVTAAAGGSARTLASRALDSVNVLDFGALQGGADCTAAFNAAFAQLPAGGGEMYLPAGDYWLFSPLVFSGKAVAIRGAGRGLTRLHLSHTGIGFDFAPGNLYGKTVLSAFSMYAESTTGQTAAAVRITYPVVTDFGYVTTSIDEIECFGYPSTASGTAPFPQTFLRGFVLNNCWSSQLANISWFGPPAAAGATSSAVVEVNGSIDTRLDNMQAYYGSALVLQTGYCQGVYISNPLVVGLDYLVLQTNPTTWTGYSAGRIELLGLWCANGEVNTGLGTVQLSGVTDGFFNSLDITRDTGPATPQVLFNLTNVSNFHVSGCNFVGGPSGGPAQDIAFSFTSTSNSSSNIIEGCHFEDMATVIQINGTNGTVGLTSFGLDLGNVPLATAIIDQSGTAAANFLTFVTRGQAGAPPGVGNSRDHVLSGATGATLFQVTNTAAAANFIRVQPATTGAPPALVFDGSDASVGGLIQTKGGSLSINANGEVLSGIRALHDTIDIRQVQAEQLHDLVRSDLATLRRDQRDLEEKFDCAVCVVQHDVEALRLGSAEHARSILDLVASVDALRGPIADIAALKSRVAGLVVAASVVGSAALWLAEPVYRWLVNATFVKR